MLLKYLEGFYLGITDLLVENFVLSAFHASEYFGLFLNELLPRELLLPELLFLPVFLDLVQLVLLNSVFFNFAVLLSLLAPLHLLQSDQVAVSFSERFLLRLHPQLASSLLVGLALEVFLDLSVQEL